MHLLTVNNLIQRIFACTDQDFEKLALDLFSYQSLENDMYHKYCQAIGKNKSNVLTLKDIPFLPIQFYKSAIISSGQYEPACIFESSQTTGSVPSRHYIKDLSVYENSFMNGFNMFYGDVKSYCILGLLPSYLERKNASLVYMVDKLIRESNQPNSGFYLHDFEKLAETIQQNEDNNQPTLLIGVSYALLEFAEKYPIQMKNTIVMETGGMKGRRKEISKANMYYILKKQFGLADIHAEYGMTELLSQAYSKKDGIFQCPPWMRIQIRPEDDPLGYSEVPMCSTDSITGAVNIIDLANIHSCCFIATDDVGKLYGDYRFEITGRMEQSDIRGCGLMIF